MRISLSTSVKIRCGLTIVLLLGQSCKPKDEASNPAGAQPVLPPALIASPTDDAAPTPLAPAETITITPEEARNHVGKIATVKGKAERVYVSQKGDVFIDMGGKHPNAAFTAVCFKQAIPTDQLRALNGKVISVTGKIKDYQGKVEIVLETADQISE